MRIIDQPLYSVLVEQGFQITEMENVAKIIRNNRSFIIEKKGGKLYNRKRNLFFSSRSHLLFWLVGQTQ